MRSLTLAKTDDGPKTDDGRGAGNVFAAARERLPGCGTVAELRREAFAAYERAGLPHRRVEEWKYTDLRALMGAVAPQAPDADAAALLRARAALAKASLAGAVRLVLVDGAFCAALSDLDLFDDGVAVGALREILESGAAEAKRDLLLTAATDAMVSLNTAMVRDGVVVSVGDGVACARPIQIVHIATAPSASVFTRSQVRLGRDARAILVESFVAAEGARAYQANDVVIVRIGDGAKLSHLRLMAHEARAVNISSGIVTVAANAKLNLFNMIRGGAVSRYQGFLTLSGEGSDLSINGVHLLKDSQHGDTTLVVDHAAPHCTSRESFRTVADDSGRSVFQGRIIVRPGAQKTDGRMMARALLLSDAAEADTKPELEIFADDVSCGHGATSGAIDEGLLFYLRARGLPEKDAQALLIQAFLGEAVEEIDDEGLRDLVTAQTAHWLEARR